MRFGLPCNFNLEVDTESRVVAVEPIVNQSIAVVPSHEKKLMPTNMKSLQPYQIKGQIVESPSRKFYTSIETYNAEYLNQIQKIAQNEIDKVRVRLDRNQILEDSNVQALIASFTNRLNLQNVEVNNLVVKEKERIRLEKELKQRQEEERRRLEEEKQRQIELEKRKKEEEQKRKEEEARRMKEKQERVHKEQLERQKIKEQEEARKKQDLENKKKLEKARKQNFTDYDAINKQFNKYKQDIADIKANVVTRLSENKELKKQVMQFKRKLNPKFGQLSNSTSQLNKISQEVISMIEMTKSNDLIYQWILNFIAKAIIDQAETEVIVRSFAALPLAHLSYHILLKFPEFEYYLSARFIKKCPYIIGYTSSLDSEQGRANMGYKRSKDDDKWESSVKYDERMSGIISVWSVMTNLNSGSQIGFYSFESSWKFLARILNLPAELLTNTHFAILGNWWEATAREFMSTYKSQGQKICRSLVNELPDVVQNRRYPSAARLRIMGEDWLKSNKIESLKPMEY